MARVGRDNRRIVQAVAAAAVLWLAGGIAHAEPAAKIDFATQIQPIFVEHCYQCHGPDKQESKLRLDNRDAALKGGDAGALWVAGNSAASELARRVSAADPEERMPPASTNKTLSPAEVQTIARWIDQGADWPDGPHSHWSFRPIQRPFPPAMQQSGWTRGPIDAFVLAGLEARGVAPSPEADRYTLIKRLYYDLVGLPPTAAEADAFAADPSPDAYERLVERLLDSPRFGERWGRHWLDLARYADSDGYEKDNPRLDAWRYRDWVIHAINADLPFDRFTIEQLAGDLLTGADADQRLATAFHRQTLTNTEGGTDQEQFRVEAIFDRVATTGTVWLGLSVGCAQCHTHKYDPITHREYYQLFAFFNDADEVETSVPLTGEALARFERQRHDATTKLANLEPKLAALTQELAAKLPAWEAELKSPTEAPFALHPVELLGIESSAGSEFKLLSDGSYLALGKNPDVDKVTVRVRTDLPKVTGFRLEALAFDTAPPRGPGRTEHGNFVLSEFRAFASATNSWKDDDRVAWRLATSDFAQGQFPASAAIDGKEPTGWAIGSQEGRDHHILFMAKEPVTGSEKPFWQLVLSQNHGTQHTLGRFRVLAVTGDDRMLGIPDDVRAVLAVALERRTAAQSQALLDYYLTQDKKAAELTAQVKKFKTQLTAEPSMKVRVLAQRTEKPRTSHILHRGDFLQPDAVVEPATLAALPKLTARNGARADRLDLARWLVDPANPLTPRVQANQVWMMLFGQGLVRTPNDFGIRGARPTHPELLDWLASEFMARGWSRKQLIREIVTSATYRQVSVTRGELVDRDPQNEWLHRQNRYRLQGEIVRDVSLAVGGLLCDKTGGPSVFPPLPPDIAELSYANNFKWNTSEGEDRYRRGMYTFFKRTAPHPNLTTFDCPDSNTTCIARQTSNTPLQALVTLNNESFTEAAQAMAAQIVRAASNDPERLSVALRRCLVRPPQPEETAAFDKLLSSARDWFSAHPDEAAKVVGRFQSAEATPVETAAWVAMLRVMLNLDEFLTRE